MESYTISDDLSVLGSTRFVVEGARSVSIDVPTTEALADRLTTDDLSPTEWDAERHFVDGTERTAQYVLVLDALNFCFWGEPRWEVEYRGDWVNGYWALAWALKRAVLEGVPILDARHLSEMSSDDLAHVLRGRGAVPLLEERLASLHEVGRVLLDRYDGQFVNAIEAADRGAVKLVRLLARDFRSFDDVATYRGREIRFYKRAQICAADLAGSFDNRLWGKFGDLDRLTAFADYKVPQVLRRLGVLRYAPGLAARVDSREQIEAGSEEEIEIRAATIWGVERIRQSLARRRRRMTASQIDWVLWTIGQRSPSDERPYHRTRTVFY